MTRWVRTGAGPRGRSSSRERGRTAPVDVVEGVRVGLGGLPRVAGVRPHVVLAVEVDDHLGGDRPEERGVLQARERGDLFGFGRPVNSPAVARWR